MNGRRNEQEGHCLVQFGTSKESHHSLSKQAPTISQGILTKEEPDLVLLRAFLAEDGQMKFVDITSWTK